jgi:hypothetical protein
VQAFMQLFSFVFILFIGFKFLLAKSVNVPTKLDAATEKIETRIEHKFHPHSAFMTGFARVLGNLGVLLFWIVLAANLMARDWVDRRFFSRQGRVRGRRAAWHDHLVHHPELRRVARARADGREDPAAPAAILRHLPHHFCLIQGVNLARHLAKHNRRQHQREEQLLPASTNTDSNSN